MNYLQHLFQVDERVSILNTSSELDGKYGTVLGKSIRETGPSYPEFYIVLLDDPASNGDKAISITEACLTWG